MPVIVRAVSPLDVRKPSGIARGCLAGIFLAVLFVSACAPRSPLVKTPAVFPGDERQLEMQLRQEAARWLGTPHRLGGDGKDGIDCSGLTVTVYRVLFGIRLPRTTRDQIRTGRPVDDRANRPGDLLFFTLPFRNRHVGIYLGAGEFLHAAKSRGVTISRIDHEYWQRHFTQARRILSFE